VAAGLRKSSNKAIEALGLPLLRAYWRLLVGEANHHGLPVVSLGSGTGAIEHDLSARAPPRHGLTLVDPNPRSWQAETAAPGIAPHFPVLSTALRKRPELQGGALFVNWPNPSDLPKFEPDEPEYDLAALATMRPALVLMAIESLGASGSYGLLSFFRDHVPDLAAIVLPEVAAVDFLELRRDDIPGPSPRVLRTLPRYRVVWSTARLVGCEKGAPPPASVPEAWLLSFRAGCVRYLLLRRDDVELAPETVAKAEALRREIVPPLPPEPAARMITGFAGLAFGAGAL
jgi:hypothetical protein